MDIEERVEKLTNEIIAKQNFPLETVAVEYVKETIAANCRKLSARRSIRKIL